MDYTVTRLNNLKFGKKNLEILCLGAHCDDVEIGCGASLIRLAAEYSIEKMVWVVLCSSEIRSLSYWLVLQPPFEIKRLRD